MVAHPPHYNQYPVEVIRVIELVLDNTELTPMEAYCMSNIIKYRLRAGLKDPAKLQEDIDKANWYMDYMNDRRKVYELGDS